MAGTIVLVSNGPGELHTWVRPVLTELRSRYPEKRVVISLIPCQFAGGGESEAARGFGPDGVTTPAQYLRLAAGGRVPEEFGGRVESVISMGGSVGMAVRLAERLGAPAFRYSFVPYWHRKLDTLFVHDERAYRKARLLGAPAGKLEVVGNLVADAVSKSEPLESRGEPHILLLPGSRDGFAVHLIPFMIALADELKASFPTARFVWPVSRMLEEETIAAGVAGTERATLHGVGGERDGDRVVGPGGAVIELVAQEERYRHMASADLAVTIPGTNTLELGIAGVPAVVVLPLNRPEVIPLEGPGHWLSLLPLVGVPLKRRAVRLFVERLSYPVSLPNQLSGEELMVEVRGQIDPQSIARRVADLLADEADLRARRERLLATMPRPGAAARIVDRVVAGPGADLAATTSGATRERGAA
ncbi:MAG TPA: hypothetical protein VF168_11640 [Trueperaceae bacterium]